MLEIKPLMVQVDSDSASRRHVGLLSQFPELKEDEVVLQTA